MPWYRREDRSKIVRRPKTRQPGTTSDGGSGSRFACPATLFVCGAGDGNRTRTISLGTNSVRESTVAGRLVCAGRGN